MFYLILAIYVIGFLYCLPIAYRWCANDSDGAHSFVYDGPGALGFSLVWFIFLPIYYFALRPAAK